MSFTAIQTKFLGPSNARGSRYKATTMGTLGDDKPRSLTLSADHRFDYMRNHCEVARALAAKLKWDGVWVRGETTEGSVFVRLTMTKGGALPALEAWDVAFVVDSAPEPADSV